MSYKKGRKYKRIRNELLNVMVRRAKKSKDNTIVLPLLFKEERTKGLIEENQSLQNITLSKVSYTCYLEPYGEPITKNLRLKVVDINEGTIQVGKDKEITYVIQVTFAYEYPIPHHSNKDYYLQLKTPQQATIEDYINIEQTRKKIAACDFEIKDYLFSEAAGLNVALAEEIYNNIALTNTPYAIDDKGEKVEPVDNALVFFRMLEERRGLERELTSFFFVEHETIALKQILSLTQLLLMLAGLGYLGFAVDEVVASNEIVFKSVIESEEAFIDLDLAIHELEEQKKHILLDKEVKALFYSKSAAIEALESEVKAKTVAYAFAMSNNGIAQNKKANLLKELASAKSKLKRLTQKNENDKDGQTKEAYQKTLDALKEVNKELSLRKTERHNLLNTSYYAYGVYDGSFELLKQAENFLATIKKSFYLYISDESTKVACEQIAKLVAYQELKKGNELNSEVRQKITDRLALLTEKYDGVAAEAFILALLLSVKDANTGKLVGLMDCGIPLDILCQRLTKIPYAKAKRITGFFLTS